MFLLADVRLKTKTKQNKNKMKKTITILAILILALSSCKKDELKECNCGIIQDDGNQNGSYWITIKSDCSGNVERFYLSQADWMNAHVGNQHCISNSDGW